MIANIKNVFGNELLEKYRQALKNKGFKVSEMVGTDEFESTTFKGYWGDFKVEFNRLDDLEKIRSACKNCALENDNDFEATLIINSPYPNGDWDITVYDGYIE